LDNYWDITMVERTITDISSNVLIWID